MISQRLPSFLLKSFLGFVLSSFAVSTISAQEDPAIKRLNESPRHHEWVEVKQGERSVHSFLVFPEVKEKAPTVLLIHENRGLTDWVKGLADQVAEAGYIAIAPDLLSGAGPEGGKTSDFVDRDAAREAIYALPQEQINADLQAVAAYVTELDAASGKLSVAGFCWGGKQTFNFATIHPGLAAAFVFYGTPVDSAAMQKIACPVYGFYGENDARVTSTVGKAEEQMKVAGKTYEPVVYDGAGHGFMRAGEQAPAGDANRVARDHAWERWMDLLEKHNAQQRAKK